MEVESKRFLLLQISGNCTENYSEIPWLNDKLRCTFLLPIGRNVNSKRSCEIKIYGSHSRLEHANWKLHLTVSMIVMVKPSLRQ